MHVSAKYHLNPVFPSLSVGTGIPEKAAEKSGKKKKKKVGNPLRGSRQGTGCPNSRYDKYLRMKLLDTDSAGPYKDTMSHVNKGIDNLALPFYPPCESCRVILEYRDVLATARNGKPSTSKNTSMESQTKFFT